MNTIRGDRSLLSGETLHCRKISRSFIAEKNSGPENSADTFTGNLTETGETGAPISQEKKADIRNPEEALKFLDTYNKNLGIGKKELDEKFEKMQESPLAFFRGNPALFYKDISGPYSIKAELSDKPAPAVTINADCHIMNFGTLKGANDDTVWGLNDFDHSATGPFTFDLIRLAASAVLALRENGVDGKTQKDLIEDLGKKYFKTVDKLESGNASSGAFLTKSEAESHVNECIKKADEKGQESFLGKIFKTDEDDRFGFIRNENLFPVSPETEGAIRKGLEDYQNRLKPDCPVAVPLEVLDIACKTGSGGSSYGLDRFYVLAASRLSGDLPFILELKQILPSSVNDQSGNLSAADGPSVIKYQKNQGGLLNPLSGHLVIGGRQFLVREKEPRKDTVKLTDLKSEEDFSDLFRQCAVVLAKAHCQTSGNSKAISKWFSGDEKKIIKNLQSFTKAYADQTQADHLALREKLSTAK